MKSDAVKTGMQQAPHRSLFNALGMTEEEMRKLFPYALEAIENTHKIAERCNVEIEFGVTKLPRYEVPEGFDSWGYLNHLCDEGLRKR